MSYPLETLVAVRVLDAQLSRHQKADSIGAHLSKIESAVAAIPTVTSNIDLTPVLNAISMLQGQISVLAAQQQSDSAKVDYLFQVLARLASNPLPLPPGAVIDPSSISTVV